MLRERVQASVLLADEFLTQTRRRVRTVIRQDLATGDLLEQTIPGRGADLTDPAVAREARPAAGPRWASDAPEAPGHYRCVQPWRQA